MPKNSGKVHFHSTHLGEYRIFQNPCNIFSVQLQTSRFALQGEKSTDLVKCAHLITYVLCMLESDTSADSLLRNLLMVKLSHWKFSK